MGFGYNGMTMPPSTPGYLRVDFHTHTIFSGDSLTTPQEIVAAARRRGLDRLVVSDHNSIQGALAARRIDPELVIVGEEIETGNGELLASFVQEEIPRGLPVQETLRRLRQQGAFVSVSHPFDPGRSKFSLAELEELAEQVDAIEIFNARCVFAWMNRRAEDFARQHSLGGTAGSDGHIAWEVGRAYLRLPAFTNANELRQVIAQGEVMKKRTPLAVHVAASIRSLPRRVFGEHAS